ncbi:tyrosine-type recombinase/integrase [Salinibacterium sp. SWN1162]|uniref:tyrosine-type recombinase/integrase n=1 Tax=Salinibacterium sp. SWN1162 TaxID=2792053 RepID=UPI0018CD6AB3|nr:tyrosine-type recombinase/integrase [Salinibacterium sp. SWN1162]MBH0009583.1 tyrosine-type recombinase/integrase [Salinibacterium sp. SWN1162]
MTFDLLFFTFRVLAVQNTSKILAGFAKFAALIQGMRKKLRVNDISDYQMAVADLRQLDPNMPDLDWAIVSKFRPRLETPAQWQAIRPFVISVVLMTQPRDFNPVRTSMTILTRYIAWVWATTGTELRFEKIFTQRFLDAFVEIGIADRSPAYRFDVYRRIAVLIEKQTDLRLKRIPEPEPSDKMVPYTASEIARFQSWALGQNSDRRRHNAYSILALCGGAGLSAAELIDTRVEHLTNDGVHTTVTVQGKRPRIVPIATAWLPALAKAVDGRLDGYLFHGNRGEEYPPRLVQGYLSEQKWDLRVSAARLRLTWIIQQFEKDLPLAVLKEICGFKNFASVDRYMHLIAARSTGDFFEQVAGSVVAR